MSSCFFESFSYAWIVTSWTTRLNLKIVIWLGVMIVGRILHAVWTWLSVNQHVFTYWWVSGLWPSRNCKSIVIVSYACVVVSMLHWFNSLFTFQIDDLPLVLQPLYYQPCDTSSCQETIKKSVYFVTLCMCICWTKLPLMYLTTFSMRFTD